MPTDSIGSTQVRELGFTRHEIMAIILENIQHRCNPSYDFCTEHPIVIYTEDGGMLFRFVQANIAREYGPRQTTFKPYKK